jgi:hypothetical protein
MRRHASGIDRFSWQDHGKTSRIGTGRHNGERHWQFADLAPSGRAGLGVSYEIDFCHN